MKHNIDSLDIGDHAQLQFIGREGAPTVTEEAILISRDGEGVTRTATFTDAAGNFPFTAYRYAGRWAYGSARDPLVYTGLINPAAEVIQVPIMSEQTVLEKIIHRAKVEYEAEPYAHGLAEYIVSLTSGARLV